MFKLCVMRKSITNEDYLHVLGDVIRGLRLTFGISQEKMAEDTGLNMSDIERGKRNITLPTLRAVADYLKFQPSHLLLMCDMYDKANSHDRYEVIYNKMQVTKNYAYLLYLLDYCKPPYKIPLVYEQWLKRKNKEIRQGRKRKKSPSMVEVIFTLARQSPDRTVMKKAEAMIRRYREEETARESEQKEKLSLRFDNRLRKKNARTGKKRKG